LLQQFSSSFVLLAEVLGLLSFRIPCLPCHLMKALVSFVDASIDSALTYQNIGSVELTGVCFGCCKMVVKIERIMMMGSLLKLEVPTHNIMNYEILA
ncbi:MAG: hypothetical protein ABI348_09675, partial [Nitrososphaera sp.]